MLKFTTESESKCDCCGVGRIDTGSNVYCEDCFAVVTDIIGELFSRLEDRNISVADIKEEYYFKLANMGLAR
jgi:hypothetical protein